METGVAIDRERLPALIDQYDTDLIVQGVDPDVVEGWSYSFPIRGEKKPAEGLSVLGVQAAVRQAAARGEVIRCLNVEMTFESDDNGPGAEARFVAIGARFAVRFDPVTGQTQEVELDRTIRAKRQPKWGRRILTGEPYYIENWFEIGYAKAARNVENALLHDATKSAIKEAARQARAEAEKRRRSAKEQPQAAQAPPALRPGDPQNLAERNEWIAAIRRGLEELRTNHPKAFNEAIEAIIASVPYATDRERRFIATKLRLEDLKPVRELVMKAVDVATGRAAQVAQVAMFGPEASAEAAAAKACAHKEPVYDGYGALVCDDCGTVLEPAPKS